MTTSRIASLLAVLGVASGLAISPSLFADCTTPQTFNVTNTSVDDGTPGTLRYLVGSATVQDCDTIMIPPGTIVYGTVVPGPIKITKNINIIGAGPDQTFIDANQGAT